MKILATLFTDVWLLSRVDSPVNAQIIAPREHLSADVAPVALCVVRSIYICVGECTKHELQ